MVGGGPVDMALLGFPFCNGSSDPTAGLRMVTRLRDWRVGQIPISCSTASGLDAWMPFVRMLHQAGDR